MFDVSLLFKIGAMGFYLWLLKKLLKGNGKNDICSIS